jgi:hypothetical protein
MRINWIGSRVALPLVWPAVVLAALAVALLVWVAPGAGPRAVPAVAAFAGVVLLGSVLQRRARAARRWSAAVNAYAEREIARARRLAVRRRAPALAAGARGWNDRRVS